MKKIIFLLFLLALFLRVFRIGVPVFTEDEFTTVKAATYVYQCQNDAENCRSQPVIFKNKLLALVTANETTPNLGAEIYLWDFIKDKASEIHHSRAWPHLYSVAAVYQVLGINEFSSRLISVLAGSLLVIVGYLFSRVMGTSINLSLIYSFLLAISFPLIDFSRNARMYAVYILAFLLLVSAIYRSKWWLVVILFLLTYWLQMLTLILPLAVLVWALIKRRWAIVFSLLLGLLSIFWLTKYFGVDFFGRQFLGFSWPPHWQYLEFLFSYPLPWWLGIFFFFAGKSNRYLKIIILTYLTILIFGTRSAPASAYVLALLPLVIWGQFSWIKNKWVLGLILLIATLRLVSGVGYLYLGHDDRAQITSAYPALVNNYQTGDKIYAVQLRDYYLSTLPKDVAVIDLDQNPQPEFTGTGFVVWEKEKAAHFQPEVLAYIKNNFYHLTGEGLDNWGVEIYSFGK